jgi:hypothetical protein
MSIIICVLCGKVAVPGATRLRTVGSRCKVSGFSHEWVIQDDIRDDT